MAEGSRIHPIDDTPPMPGSCNDSAPSAVVTGEQNEAAPDSPISRQISEPGLLRIHPAPEDKAMFEEAAEAGGWVKALKSQDRLMYIMTDQVHPMVVHCLVGLAQPFGPGKLDEMGWSLVENYVSFKSVIENGQWTNAKVEMSNHTITSELPPGEDIQKFCSVLISTPLEMDIPLWQLHLVTQQSTNEHVLVVRIHHCVGDGIALMTILDKLLKRHEPSARLSNRQRRKTPCYIKAIQAFMVLLLAPLVMLQLLFMRRDPHTCFRQENNTVMKVVRWLNPMSLTEVNLVAKKVGGTVNDVLCSVAAGSISRYIEATEGKKFKKDIKCIVPYSVRSWPERFDVNNRVGAIFVNLPTHCDDPLKRMRITKKRMDGLKNSAWVPVTLMLIRVTTRAVSARICSWLQHFYASKCTLIFSNVRAASSESELMEQKVTSVMGFVPLAGHLNLTFSTVSYNEQIMLGVVANPKALTQPKLLTDMFVLEFAELKESLGLNDVADIENGDESVPLGMTSKSSLKSFSTQERDAAETLRRDPMQIEEPMSPSA